MGSPPEATRVRPFARFGPHARLPAFVIYLVKRVASGTQGRNGAAEGQLLFKERRISGAWRSGLRKAVRVEDTGYVSKLYFKTLFNSENFHSSAKRELTPAIVSLSTSREVDICHLHIPNQ